MPMLDAPGSRGDIVAAEAARLHAYDAGLRSLLDVVRDDRLGPPASRPLTAKLQTVAPAPHRRFGGEV